MYAAVANDPLWRFVWNGSSIYWSLWLRPSIRNSATYLRQPDGNVLWCIITSRIPRSEFYKAIARKTDIHFLLQHSADSDTYWYTVSGINLTQSSINVFHLTQMMSRH